MEIDDLKSLTETEIHERLRALSRERLDETFQRFGAQYAHLCQRLEGVYNREARFAKVRPGGLAEIDEAIRLAERDYQQEVTLLKSFRELNRILLPFMDVYEEQVMGDLKHMSKDELLEMHTTLKAEIERAQKQQTTDPLQYRQAQDAQGSLRLATLMNEAALRELKERFGTEPEL